MSNYVTIKHKKGDLHHRCKFNVSESLADTVLKNLKTYFEIELKEGSVYTQNKRTIIEIQVSEPHAAIIKQAFLTQLPIFENQN